MTYTKKQLVDIVNDQSLTGTTRLKALWKLFGAAEGGKQAGLRRPRIKAEPFHREIISLPDPFIWHGDFRTAILYVDTLPKDIRVSGTLEINHVEGADKIHNVAARRIEIVEDDINREIDGRVKADELLITASSIEVLKHLLSKCTLDIKDKVVVAHWKWRHTDEEWEEIVTFLHQKGIPKDKVYRYY